MNEIETTEILNDIEKDKIIAFCSDVIMFEAVKKFLLAFLYEHGVMVPGKPHKGNLNWALSLAFEATAPQSHGGSKQTNEELGADLRAVAKGIQVIESGFVELKAFKRPDAPKKEPENPAL